MTNYDILKEYEAHQTPVPSYEEWQRILHYAGKYEFEYTSCVMDYENLKEENTKLKKLLKKHRDIFARTLALCIDLNFGEKQKNQFADDIAEIDQALGEDK